MKEKVIVCRCEDVTEDEITEAIQSGATTLEDLKRILRVGMGPCQGRTCGSILVSLLARELNKKPKEIKQWNKRPPLKPVHMKIFVEE